MRWPMGGEEASARGRTSQTTDLATQYIVDGNSWLSIIPMQGLKCQPANRPSDVDDNDS